jgi:hypothetical protein
MAKNNNILEEAIIQMKNLEEAVTENAKGILGSVMSQEIKELVKESLMEADEDEEEVDDIADVEFPSDEDDEDDFSDEEDVDYEEDDEMSDEDMEFDTDDDDEEVVDLTTLDQQGLSDEESAEVLMKVYKAMKPSDKIEVQKNSDGNIHLTDDNTETEYLIVTEDTNERKYYGDADIDEELDEMYKDKEYMDEDYMDEDYMDEDYMEEDYMEEGMYKHNMDERYSDEELEELYMDEGDYRHHMGEEDEFEELDEELFDEEDDYMDEGMYKHQTDEDDEEEDYGDTLNRFGKELGETTMYEVEMDEEDEYIEEDYVYESKSHSKGSASKFKYPKSVNNQGFDTDMKQGTKGVNFGSAKKVKIYDTNSPSFDGDFDEKPTKSKEPKGSMKFTPRKMETKEASRTNSYVTSGKAGMRKGADRYENRTKVRVRESFDNTEMELLREKNEEYRKALNIFRNKLNEVAVFNSNLAYATRLFTEHTTSKNEKINILKRFDEIETLKESKNLYKQIKDELTVNSPQPMNESVERAIQKSPMNGSSINLIESKTYQNPQFLRMKDLMTKMK